MAADRQVAVYVGFDFDRTEAVTLAVDGLRVGAQICRQNHHVVEADELDARADKLAAVMWTINEAYREART